MYIVNVECMQHLSSALAKICSIGWTVWEQYLCSKCVNLRIETPFNDVKNDQASAASVFAFASDFWYRALYVWGKKYLFAPYL